MKKFYKIVILFVALIFLTTYSPSGLNFFPKKKNLFFKIQNIEVLNNNLITKSEIVRKLTQVYNKNILLIEKNEIVESLKFIDFLEKIEVKKKYPNTILITVYETKPIAILYKNNSKYIIDSSSNLNAFNESISINNFPIVFGEGAEREFINFFNELEDNDFPKQRIKNYYYFQIGRWDLQLLNDQTIKFPTKRIHKSIQQSVELLNHKDFENYNVIDLRIHGKIVVE